MAKLKINHYVVGPVQTNCYFAINDETKELIIIDPGLQSQAAGGACASGRMYTSGNSADTWTF